MTKNLCYLLGAFAIFFGLLVPVHAARWAVVTSARATIFSDVQMSSVIGFVRKGKRVRVGEIPKNKGRVLPIIVNKKIAYIQVDDIAISASKEAIYSATERITKKMNEVTDETKISFYGGTSISKVDFASSQRNDPSYTLLFWNVGVRGYYRKLGEKRGMRSSIEYTYGARDEEQLSWFSVSLDYTWPVLESHKYDFLFYAGGTISPFVSYEVDDLFTLNGNAFGGQVGLDMKIELPGRWSMNIEGGYQLMKITSLNLPDNAFYGKTIDPLINSARASFGFTYTY